MGSIGLSYYQRRVLRKQMSIHENIDIYRQALCLLELDNGRPIVDIAGIMHVERRTIRRWVQRYLHNPQPSSLQRRKGQGRPRLFSKQRQKLIKARLQHSPQDFGYHAANWTVSLLCDYISKNMQMNVSFHTVRRYLEEWGYVWKRYRYVLPPDPEREKKKAYLEYNQAIGW
jgi:transposase